MLQSKKDEKFTHPFKTLQGKERAYVDLTALKTLWINTGTRCNLTCENCYIESSPTNDRLEYITNEEVLPFLEEIKSENYPVEYIGLTGGEPFLNPEITKILSTILKHDFEVLVLTNAYRVINRHLDELVKIKEIYGDKLHIRVSLDHHTLDIHEEQRGKGTFNKTLEQIKWLCDQSFNISIAGRSLTNESLEQEKECYQNLFKKWNIPLSLSDKKIVVFPEMDLNRDVPEITTECWSILNKSPNDQMCATERMIVKRKGDASVTVLPCTLLAYDEQFNLGSTLKDSKSRVQLNHKFCAQFCVLGGASCSSAK
ncbi:radical SAM protein [Halobacteriovorax sp. GB3]|uniref:radical SAM protein n=1 Tax=Halobacteriovorax sp. GB3 TaxID=2719615 RepID=UPI00235F6C29|nr:radical SAM protein [Halobacteriovorax sp. GB3]MDD0851783.1 radical SAM protein [Halobacteriovorax sp. GB3]